MGNYEMDDMVRSTITDTIVDRYRERGNGYKIAFYGEATNISGRKLDAQCLVIINEPDEDDADYERFICCAPCLGSPEIDEAVAFDMLVDALVEDAEARKLLIS